MHKYEPSSYFPVLSGRIVFIFFQMLFTCNLKTPGSTPSPLFSETQLAVKAQACQAPVIFFSLMRSSKSASLPFLSRSLAGQGI